MARDKLSEIAARRERSQFGSWRSKSELEALARQWQREAGSQELLPQFIPVRLVTILEVFTRNWVAELVDAGEPFTSRGTDLVKGSLKIDYAVAQALVGKHVTFGELVSHDISLNNVGDIDKALSTLIDSPVFQILDQAGDEWPASEHKDPSLPRLLDANWARAQIGRLFGERHIIVHELPDERNLGLEEITDFLRATVQFVEAADHHFIKLLHGDQPTTQQGMTAAAVQKAEEADAELNRIISQLDPNRSDKRLMAAQDAWESYCIKQAAYRSGLSDGGSIQPMLVAAERERITRERIELLTWYNSRSEGDM